MSEQSHSSEYRQQATFEQLAQQTHAELLAWLQDHNINPTDVLLAGYVNAGATEKGNPEFETGRIDANGAPVERIFLGSVDDLLHTDEEGKHANPLFFAVGRPLDHEQPKPGYIGVYLRDLLKSYIVEAEDPDEPEYGTVLLETSIPALKDALIVERNIDI